MTNMDELLEFIENKPQSGDLIILADMLRKQPNSPDTLIWLFFTSTQEDLEVILEMDNPVSSNLASSLYSVGY